MLVLISVDLMWEWLVVASGKMMAMEYATCLATFIFIMVAGIETGKSVCPSICPSVCLGFIHYYYHHVIWIANTPSKRLPLRSFHL